MMDDYRKAAWAKDVANEKAEPAMFGNNMSDNMSSNMANPKPKSFATQERRGAEIPECMKHLSEAIARANDELELLCERLTPVMGPVARPGETRPKELCGITKVGVELAVYVERVGVLAELIHAVREGLEL